MKYLYPTSSHRTFVCTSSLQEFYVVIINSSNARFNSNIKSLQEGANYNVFFFNIEQDCSICLTNDKTSYSN